MYAKINGGTVTKFPYTFGDLRKDHPNVSFPKNITATIMQKYGMVGVLEGPKPTLGAYQTVQRNALPTRPVLRYTTNEDATDPVTGEVDFSQVGLPVRANYWMIEYTAVDMFADDEESTKAEKEAAYQATLDAKVAEANRTKRNDLLAATDYLALTDNTMDAITIEYSQALRDITNHANWPHLEDSDWPVKP